MIFVQAVKGVTYGEIARITLPNGEERTGQVLDVSKDLAVIQVFEGTSGIDDQETRVRFTGEPLKVDVSIDMLGRIFNGVGKPRDGGPEVIQEASLDINGMPINPYARDKPADFIQTGMSAIDALNHPCKRAETPDIHRFRPACKQAGRPDRPPGKSPWGGGELCGGLCCHGDHL